MNMLVIVNVAEAIYMLYRPDYESDKTAPAPGSIEKFILIGTNTISGDVFSVEVEGEAFAYLTMAVLVSSEDLLEAGVDLEADTHVGRAYKLLKNSDLSDFLP